MSGARSSGAPPAPREGGKRPRRGDELELQVESLAHGGAGVARLERYVVFVEGGFPGERVRAEVWRSKRDYAHARAIEVLEPSPDRVPVRCDHEGGECPGSPWQPLRYERQLEHKQQLVAEALTRIGHLEGFELEPIVPAADPWRYRNKLEYSFGEQLPSAGKPADGLAAGRGPLVLGFHARGRWDRVDDARDCLLASERNNAVRNLVRDWCSDQGLSALDRRTHTGLLRNLVVREGRRTGDLQVRLVTSQGAFDVDGLAGAVLGRFPGAGFLWTRAASVAEVTHEGPTEVVAGEERLHERVGDLEFAISPTAFFQTNTEMAERLYALAAEYAGLRGTERVYDLYCGIGTLSLTLALRGGEVWGVEVSEEAVADAIRNAELNEIDNARFFAGDVRHALRPLAERAPRPDVVVVDPPRAGLSAKVVRRLLETAPRRVVYVSCNPTTLAPNAAQMVEAGYRLVKVRPVDMFPHTPHIECVAVLEREGSGG
jgi:23S rRNA (uracil1939-C5)-methyltransferase